MKSKIEKVKNRISQICIGLILSALFVYIFFGNEKLVVQLLVVVFFLWGLKTILDYKDDSTMHLYVQIVPPDAPEIERAVWFWIAVFLVVSSVILFVKLLIGSYDYLY
ncbi:hypothetical protein [Pleionea mediterranea]|uniref:Uncharacterized protein n=1 Tax=Pleionea mediterranea TaxID=523701 RepID=A0A316FZD5_9GAMM|nr:hypothetical protein [Pleionea mediterranea]PWK53066.1 hypothetical protein C8D97_104284 [Pleionea mediterranea]